MNHLERDKNRTLAVPAASMRIAKEPLTNGRLRPHLGVEGDNPGFASLFGSDVNGARKEARAAIRSVGAGAVEHHARRAEPLRVSDAVFGVFTGLHRSSPDFQNSAKQHLLPVVCRSFSAPQPGTGSRPLAAHRCKVGAGARPAAHSARQGSGRQSTRHQ